MTNITNKLHTIFVVINSTVNIEAYAALIRYCRQFRLYSIDAEDLAQETIMRCIKALGDKLIPLAYAITTARNIFLTEIKKSNPSLQVSLEEATEEERDGYYVNKTMADISFKNYLEAQRDAKQQELLSTLLKIVERALARFEDEDRRILEMMLQGLLVDQIVIALYGNTGFHDLLVKSMKHNILLLKRKLIRIARMMRTWMIESDNDGDDGGNTPQPGRNRFKKNKETDVQSSPVRGGDPDKKDTTLYKREIIYFHVALFDDEAFWNLLCGAYQQRPRDFSENVSLEEEQDCAIPLVYLDNTCSITHNPEDTHQPVTIMIDTSGSYCDQNLSSPSVKIIWIENVILGIGGTGAWISSLHRSILEAHYHHCVINIDALAIDNTPSLLDVSPWYEAEPYFHRVEAIRHDLSVLGIMPIRELNHPQPNNANKLVNNLGYADSDRHNIWRVMQWYDEILPLEQWHGATPLFRIVQLYGAIMSLMTMQTQIFQLPKSTPSERKSRMAEWACDSRTHWQDGASAESLGATQACREIRRPSFNDVGFSFCGPVGQGPLVHELIADSQRSSAIGRVDATRVTSGVTVCEDPQLFLSEVKQRAETSDDDSQGLADQSFGVEQTGGRRIFSKLRYCSLSLAGMDPRAQKTPDAEHAVPANPCFRHAEFQAVLLRRLQRGRRLRVREFPVSGDAVMSHRSGMRQSFLHHEPSRPTIDIERTVEALRKATEVSTSGEGTLLSMQDANESLCAYQQSKVYGERQKVKPIFSRPQQTGSGYAGFDMESLFYYAGHGSNELLRKADQMRPQSDESMETMEIAFRTYCRGMFAGSIAQEDWGRRGSPHQKYQRSQDKYDTCIELIPRFSDHLGKTKLVMRHANTDFHDGRSTAGSDGFLPIASSIATLGVQVQ